MAQNIQIPMLVDLYKNTVTDSKYYGMYYPRIFKRDGLNLKGFARHISEHGSLVDYKLAVLVLQNIVECLKEMMIQGIPVKLDGLGIFSPGLQSSKGGSESIEGFDPSTMIEGIRINFRPEGAGFVDDKLDKKTLKDAAVFQMNDFVVVNHKWVDGKDQTYQVRTPISQYAIAVAEPETPPTPDDGDDDDDGD